MMEYPAIDLKTLAAYNNLQYLYYKKPLVDYVNNAVRDAALMKRAMDYVNEVYAEWEAKRKNAYYKILNRDVLCRFMSNVEGKERSEDECYRELEFFLSYCLGLYCNGNRNNNIVSFILDMGIDNDWTGFVLSFNPDRELLSKLIKSEALSQKMLLDRLIHYHRCDEGFERYYDALSLEKKLKLIDSPYYDGEFFILYENFILPTVLIAKARDYELYAEFLRQYSLSPVQRQVLMALKDPAQVLALFESVSSVAVRDDSTTVLQYVILNYWYECLLTAAKNYAAGYKGGDSDSSKVWQELSSEHKANEELMIQGAFKKFIEILGPQAIAKWIFSKQKLVPPRETLDSKISNQLLGDCKNTALSLIGASSFDPSIRDMAYLSQYAEYFSENEANADLYNQLWVSMSEAIRTDRNYLSGNITEELLSRIHIPANFINTRLGDRIEQLSQEALATVQVRYEGLMATSPKEQFNRAAAESQFLLIFLYLTAFIDDKDMAIRQFNKISTYTLRQCVYCENRVLIDDFYQRILDLCELIADQRLPEVKKEFEHNCIHIFPDIATLIYVFLKSQSKISDEAKDWLMTKGRHDWEILKNRLLSRKQHQYADNLENALRQILI